MKHIKLVQDFITTINRKEGEWVAWVSFPITLFIFAEVILRYSFNSPTIWIWDLAIILQAFLILCTGGFVLAEEGHVMVDIFVSRFSAKVRAIMNLVISPFVLFTIGALTYQWVKTANGSVAVKERLSTLWAPPVYPLKVLIAIGMILLLLQVIAHVLRDIRYLKNQTGISSRSK